MLEWPTDESVNKRVKHDMDTLYDDALVNILMTVLIRKRCSNIQLLASVCSRWQRIVLRCWPRAARLCPKTEYQTDDDVLRQIDYIRTGQWLDNRNRRGILMVGTMCLDLHVTLSGRRIRALDIVVGCWEHQASVSLTRNDAGVYVVDSTKINIVYKGRYQLVDSNTIKHYRDKVLDVLYIAYPELSDVIAR